MKFSVFVNAAPTLPAAEAALRFCHALTASQHILHRLFFFEDGVLNSARTAPLCDQWAEFITTHTIDALCCSGACARLTLADDEGRPKPRMHSAFAVAGLGQLVAATSQSNRCITFGQRLC